MRRRGLSVPIFRRNRVTAMDRDALPIRKRDNFGYRAKWNASRRISNSTGRVSPSTLVPITVLSSSRVLFSFVFVLLPANVTGVKFETGSNLHRPGETATCRARGFTEGNSDWWVYRVISDGFALWKEWLGLFDGMELPISFISSISRDLHQDITMDLRYLNYSCLVSSYLKWIQFSIIFMLTATTFYLSLVTCRKI